MLNFAAQWFQRLSLRSPHRRALLPPRGIVDRELPAPPALSAAKSPPSQSAATTLQPKAFSTAESIAAPPP
ncbi:MAG TPA: hypothetical protein DCS91_06780 [Microcoleaceae bacterium UBA11344]|nr:hypothetical protein [Microcoleaceae cyanobacterium UBA11344]